ncbi:Histone-lysine N-methyltransferase 2E [Sparganum proliferum]
MLRTKSEIPASIPLYDTDLTETFGEPIPPVPDVGSNVVINEHNKNVPIFGSPPKIWSGKRVLCSFSANGSDSDEYPFHAVTFGESASSTGLSYNDHSYAKTDQGEPKNCPENGDNQLALLAKLALAKHDTPESSHVDCLEDFDSAVDNLCISDGLVERSSAATKSSGVPHVTIIKQPYISPTNGHQVANQFQSHIPGTTCKVTPANGRAILLAPTRGSLAASVQIHRVTSVAPQPVLLRTDMPPVDGSSVQNPPATVQAQFRCICGFTHDDGCLVQCTNCRVLQHAECMTPPGSILPKPYFCESCQPRPVVPAEAANLQRKKLAAAGINQIAPAKTIRLTNAGIRFPANKFTSPGGALQHLSPSNRFFLTTPVNGALPVRPIQVRLGELPSGAVIGQSVGGTTIYQVDASALNQLQPRTINLDPRPYVTCGQRASKRKQDLFTLAGESSTAFDNMSTNFRFEETANTEENEELPCPKFYRTPSNTSEVEANKSAYTPRVSTNYTGRSIISQETIANSSAHSVPEPASPDVVIWNDSYEEALETRISDALKQRIRNVFLTSSARELDNLQVSDSTLSSVNRAHRCHVASLEFNKKGLVATEHIYPRQPIVEYRGNAMLLNEYSEQQDYRRHYNPFMLFYKKLDKTVICVDARNYGNEARFIRRSCNPNCEVRLVFPPTDSFSSVINPQCIKFVVVATRVIPSGTELTIPFDFDYTSCWYPVKCACSRRGCSVAKWFKSGYQASLHPGSNSPVDGDTGGHSQQLYDPPSQFHSEKFSPRHDWSRDASDDDVDDDNSEDDDEDEREQEEEDDEEAHLPKSFDESNYVPYNSLHKRLGSDLKVETSALSDRTRGKIPTRRLLGPKRSAAGISMLTYHSNKHSSSGLVDSGGHRRRARGRGRGRGRGKTPSNLRQGKARGNRHGGRGRSVNREISSTRPHQVSPLFSHTRFPPESRSHPVGATSPVHTRKRRPSSTLFSNGSAELSDSDVSGPSSVYSQGASIDATESIKDPPVLSSPVQSARKKPKHRHRSPNRQQQNWQTTSDVRPGRRRRSGPSPVSLEPAISPSGPLSPPLLVRSRATCSLSENSDKLPDTVDVMQADMQRDDNEDVEEKRSAAVEGTKNQEHPLTPRSLVKGPKKKTTRRPPRQTPADVETSPKSPELPMASGTKRQRQTIGEAGNGLPTVSDQLPNEFSPANAACHTDVRSPEPKRKTSVSASREDTWMAEVLRRIERMEKKQKKRPSTTSQDEVKPTSKISQGSIDTSHLVSPISPLPAPDDGNGVSLCREKSTKSRVWSTSSGEDVFVGAGDTSSLSSPPGLKLVTTASEPLKMSRSAQGVLKPEPPKDEGPESPSEQSRSRRKKSQVSASTAPDSSGQSTGLSREDRWLQLQLQRIAEMENKPAKTTQKSSHTDVASTNATKPDVSGSLDFTVSLMTAHVSEAGGPAGFQQRSSKRTVRQASSKSKRRRRASNPRASATSDESSFDAVDGAVDQAWRSPVSTESALCSSPRADPTSVCSPKDGEAECGLIVYRRREVDPMAKFSRSRSVSYTNPPVLSVDVSQLMHHPLDGLSSKGEDFDDEVLQGGELLDDHPSTVQVNSYSALEHLTTSRPTTPKPSKKRWLSQALMEGGIEMQNNLVNQTAGFSVPALPPQLLPATGDPDSTSRHNAPSLNPKKRIISQLAEAEAAVAESPVPILSEPTPKDEESGSTVPAEAPAVDMTTSSDPALSPLTITNGVPVWTPTTVPLEASTPDSHPTPTSQLPPKKATVKRQVEELRKQEMGKVRMSLSEYRRRRGLSVTESKEPPSVQQPPVAEVKSTPAPSTAPVLLDDLPPDFEHLVSEKAHLVDIPAVISSALSEAVSTGLPLEQSSSGRVEKVAIEHGPRTPSEPPDDDDDDDVISPLVSPKDVPPPPPPPPPPPLPLSVHSLPPQDPRVNRDLFQTSSVFSHRRNGTFRHSSTSDVDFTGPHSNIGISNQDLQAPYSPHEGTTLPGVNPAVFGSSRAFADLGSELQSRREDDSFLPTRRTSVSTSVFETYDQFKNNLPPSPPPLPSWSEHSCKSSELSSRLSPQSAEYTRNSLRSSTTSDSLSTILKRDQEIRVWQETHSLRRNFTPPPSTSQHRPYPHEQRSLRNSTSSQEANRNSGQSLRHHSQPQLVHYHHLHHHHTGLHLDSQRKEAFSGGCAGSHHSDSSGPNHSPKLPAYSNSSYPLSTDNIENVQEALRRHRDQLRAQLDLTRNSTSVVTASGNTMGSSGLTKGRSSTSSAQQSGDKILEQSRFRNDVVPVPNGGLPLLGPYSRDIFVPRHASSS